MTLFDTLGFSLSVTAPIFLWMLGGYGLARIGCFPISWRSHVNRLIFYVSLPLLMFVSILKRPLGEVWEPTLTALLCGTTILVFGLSVCWSRLAFKDKATDSSKAQTKDNDLSMALVSQAAFRGNLGIIGIYLCLQAFGEAVLPVASLLMALVSILYNALSVFVFEMAVFQRGTNRPAYLQWRVWLNILLNPLILATLTAMLLSGLQVRLPVNLLSAGEDFVAWTLPLALLSIGASISLPAGGAQREVASSAWYMRPMCIVLTLKLLVKPLLAATLAWWLGYRGMLLGTVFFFAAAPTAAASFVVAKAYGADETLAAKALVFSSLLSLLSISAGVFILRGLGWM